MRDQAVTAGDLFECDAAQHNIDDGSITHGNQLSRKTTEKEEEEGAHADDQKIWLVCTVCGYRREVDQRWPTIILSRQNRRRMPLKDRIRRQTIDRAWQEEN